MAAGRRIGIGVAGALGRMGRAVIAELAEAGIPSVTRFGTPGCKAEGLTSAEDALASCEVIIDFTTAEASTQLAQAAAARGAPALVIGSTGFSPDQEDTIALAAHRLAIVKSGNFSVGAAVLLSLARRAAQRLPPDAWDVEIFEAHHRMKRDAPSGTALALGEAVAVGRKVAAAPRTGPRGGNEIGFSVMRAGAIVGEHSVVFASDGEVMTLSHSARDRRIFATGALTAARWVAGKPPGLYAMTDVLGL